MSKLYKNWWMHNLVGHPLMQIFYGIRLEHIGNRIHDSTLPLDHDPQEPHN
jgi:hypothetical protein